MINILHIINGWPSGGIAEQTYLICKYLPKDQFKQYSIGYCHFDGAFVKKFEEIGVPCIHSDEQYSNLEQILRDYKIDIVHKQTGGGDCPDYVFLLKKLRIPFIETLHCPRASGIALDLIDKIIYTTPYTLYKNDMKHREKMVSIQYALDIKEPFVNNIIERNRCELIVGRMGRIIQEKRCDVLLEIADLAYEDFAGMIQFHVAGMAPQDSRLNIEYGQWFANEVSKRPNMKYFGYIENKYDFWKTLDICINPVWETSFDIVFLEAMACGIPILTWDNSAAKYVVGNAGLVVNEDIGLMYQGLVKLFHDYGLRTLLGKIGIEYIKTKYSLQKFIDSYINLYNEVIK